MLLANVMLRTADATRWQGCRAHADLRAALVQEVQRLADGRSHEPVPDGIGVEFTRAKVEPMVRGLFPRAEQDVVLAMLEKPSSTSRARRSSRS
jgi:hypothetical protein